VETRPVSQLCGPWARPVDGIIAGMELRLLRYFVAVARAGHFGRGAEALRVSTPTLSQQIKALEREIGAPLFVRHSRGARLTPAGEVLLVEAERTLRAAADAVRATRRAAGIAEPVLRLGLLNGVPEGIPVEFERLLDEHAPGCRVVLSGGSTVEQLALLERDEIDLALVRSPVPAIPGTATLEVGKEALGVLMPAEHPLGASAELDLDDLAGVEMILFPRDRAPVFYDGLVRQLGAAGVAASDSAAPHAQLRSVLLMHRDAVTLGSVRTAGQPGLTWRPLRGEPIVVTYSALWRTASRNPALRALVQALLAGG
jgi:DNA-binding transcriptional LysR family regulator